MLRILDKCVSSLSSLVFAYALIFWGVDLRSATRQQKLELEKVRPNFQRELELHKKVVLEWVHAELAIIREKDDEDANSVDNRSGLAGHQGNRTCTLEDDFDKG